MKVRLRDCVQLVKSRVSTGNAIRENYVSTDNMIVNRGGVNFGESSLPQSKTVNDYQKGDVLVSNIRPYFKKIWFADRDGTRSSDVLCFRKTDESLTDEYLYCILQSDHFFDYVVSTSKGTKMPRGDKEAILEYEFDLPNKEVQYDNCHPILLVEQKMILNKKINDNLNSLLDCIFNNFYPHENNEISSKLKTIAEIGSSNRIFAKEYRDVGIPFLRGKEISLLSQGTTPKDTLFISSERYRELKNIPNSKDILITSVGTIGNVYQVEKFRLPFYYKDGNIIRVTPKKGFEDYIYLWLNSKFGDEAIKAVTIGSTQKALTISSIKKFELYVPNNYELQSFNNLVDPLINQIQENHKENECLQEVKSILLNKYF